VEGVSGQPGTPLDEAWVREIVSAIKDGRAILLLDVRALAATDAGRSRIDRLIADEEAAGIAAAAAARQAGDPTSTERTGP
jgi:hypothetical protein